MDQDSMETIFKRVFKRLPAVASLDSSNCSLPIRMQTQNYRSVCLRKVLQPIKEQDKNDWEKHKEDLGRLVLHLFKQDPVYQEKLQELVDIKMASHHKQMLSGVQKPDISSERMDHIRQRFEIRKREVEHQIKSWCESVVSSQQFNGLQPFLEKVVDVTPSTIDKKPRDGTIAEEQVLSLLLEELPPGFTMYTSCTVVSVDGSAVGSVHHQKGEIDILIVGPEGTAQHILEVKTARGNPYLVLYDDVDKLTNLMDKVRGKSVTLICNSSQAGTADRQSQIKVQLPFDVDLKSAYVLGSSSIGPKTMEAARHCLMSMTIGSVLSSNTDVWKETKILEVTPENVTLQVEGSLLSGCLERIQNFNSKLEALDVYVVRSESDLASELCT